MCHFGALEKDLLFFLMQKVKYVIFILILTNNINDTIMGVTQSKNKYEG